MSKKAETTGADPARPADTAPSSALTAVSGLMDERRRYDSWLAGLEARRDTTPPRVFARVHADYTTRLEAVVAQLVTHVEALRGELGRLTTQLTSLHEEQQHARDERAEAELRAHVGELTAAEWETTARSADERIDGLVSRHADIETELRRTRELLADAERPATPHLSSKAVPGRTAVDPAVDASVSASVNAAAANPTPAGMPAVGDSAEAAMHVPAAAKPAATDAPRRGTSSFDELAFLSSVVDTPAAPPAPASPAPAPKDEPARAETAPVRREAYTARTRESGIENLDATADTSILNKPAKQGVPMAANISGNNPIILKDKSGENAKTLKCADCGAMNYPTEWYCERCGAELASL